MQDVRDDFHLLNGGATENVGAIANCENDMCSALQQQISSNSRNSSPTIVKLAITTDNNINNNNFDINTVHNSIKLEDNNNSIDLFPTHPTTWQQHPMNSHEHAHHRLQQHSSQRSLDAWTKKLLLLRSDDPMICRGATNDDEHPAEYKTLIAAVADSSKHETAPQQQTQIHTQTHHNNTQAVATMPQSSRAAAPPGTEQKRTPHVGCSSLTKQQLKVKAGLMSAQNQLQNNNKTSNATATTTITATTTTAAATVATAATKQRIPKPKKKGAVKLRFHHQALPPEYLSHYEATQAQLTATRSQTTHKEAKKETHAVKLSHTAKLPPPKSAHENVRSWLQKIAELQRSAQQQQQQPPQQKQQQPQLLQTAQQQLSGDTITCRLQHDANNNHQLISSMLEEHTTPTLVATCPTAVYERMPLPPAATSTPKHESCAAALDAHSKSTLSIAADLRSSVAVKRVINYADLPYMGEITLDNCKPRRGRKPKKTDICHLIYKNYGTIFPGTPKNAFNTSHDMAKTLELKTETQRLLEEPLNLCLRDQSLDLYSVSSDDDVDDDDDAQISEQLSSCPTPVAAATLADVATDQLLAANLTMSMPGLETKVESLVATQKQPKLELDMEMSCLAKTTGVEAALEPPLHPMSVYYQKLLESGTLIQQSANGGVQAHAFGLPVETIRKDNQLALKIPIPSGLFLTPKVEKISPISNASNHTTAPPLQSSNNIDYPEQLSTPSSIKSENSTATNTTNNSSANTHQLPPQKRKRSAIFIPPMPAENTTNPATEVSICKFKFTGGAKPTLQEKKMLSVDSDGNYRYYSGTGAMRGYEFFPRESLQQSGVIPGVNCAGAFLNAASEKLPVDIPPPSAGLSNELLQIPDSPTAALLLPAAPTSSLESSTCTSPQTPLSPYSISPPALRQLSHSPSTYLTQADKSQPASTERCHQELHNSVEPATSPLNAAQRSAERKKKSRRSAQREKLEKTFKEKGFLIQTQQLESAEGATYCKFRQLKKFTRYLFRNWKDYLPDVQNGNGVIQKIHANVGQEIAIENMLASTNAYNSGDSSQPIQQHILKDHQQHTRNAAGIAITNAPENSN